jgi:hypothetical protein
LLKNIDDGSILLSGILMNISQAVTVKISDQKMTGSKSSVRPSLMTCVAEKQISPNAQAILIEINDCLSVLYRLFILVAYRPGALPLTFRV